MEQNNEIRVTIPEGYEIDTEHSTFECIKFKKKHRINTWKDLKFIQGYFIENDSSIEKLEEVIEKDCEDRNVFAYEKYAKAALALAQISQLMPYYGGEVTNEEWKNNERKFSIVVHNSELKPFTHVNNKVLISFHTEAQRARFMFFQENVQLVKDFYMIS
jgi:hypothetical protein